MSPKQYVRKVSDSQPFTSERVLFHSSSGNLTNVSSGDTGTIISAEPCSYIAFDNGIIVEYDENDDYDYLEDTSDAPVKELVTIRHDTGMWNEGFYLANYPYVQFSTGGNTDLIKNLVESYTHHRMYSFEFSIEKHQWFGQDLSETEALHIVRQALTGWEGI